MSLPAFPLSALAAFFIERQHLDRPRGRRLTARSLLRFAEDAGGIQLDSINVVERAHHLTLWNRFGPYDRRLLERLAYRRRLLFEYWAHAACLVPVTQLAPWRRAMLDGGARAAGGAGRGAALGGGVPAVAPAALAPRAGSRHRGRPAHVPFLPTRGRPGR